jgi:hypothetical protein
MDCGMNWLAVLAMAPLSLFVIWQLWSCILQHWNRDDYGTFLAVIGAMTMMFAFLWGASHL